MRVALVRAAPLMALLLASMAFAGCGAKGPVVKEQVTPYIPAETGHTDSTGSIVGTVVDEEYQPLRGALVGFVEPYMAAVTDEGGRFEIGQLEPKVWDLYVVHMGHKSDGKRVRVAAGEATEVQFILPILPVEEPWHDTKVLVGSLATSIAIAPNYYSYTTGTTVNYFSTSDKADALEAVVTGLKWENSNALGTGLQMWLYARGSGASVHQLAYGKGTAWPLILTADAEKLDQALAAKLARCHPLKCEFQTLVRTNPNALGTSVDVGIATNQNFEIHVGLFYRMLPPEGYDPTYD
jgi:predicted small lipoprotein YifL